MGAGWTGHSARQIIVVRSSGEPQEQTMGAE
jgi:hypothetical protein